MRVGKSIGPPRKSRLLPPPTRRTSVSILGDVTPIPRGRRGLDVVPTASARDRRQLAMDSALGQVSHPPPALSRHAFKATLQTIP